MAGWHSVRGRVKELAGNTPLTGTLPVAATTARDGTALHDGGDASKSSVEEHSVSDLVTRNTAESHAIVHLTGHNYGKSRYLDDRQGYPSRRGYGDVPEQDRQKCTFDGRALAVIRPTRDGVADVIVNSDGLAPVRVALQIGNP